MNVYNHGLKSGFVIFVCLAQPALTNHAYAKGLHLGWCNGVGNTHHHSNCNGGATQTSGVQNTNNLQTVTPVVNQQQQTGNQGGGTSPSYLVPMASKKPPLVPPQQPNPVPTPTPPKQPYAVPTPLPQVTQQTPPLVPPQQPNPVPTPTPPKQPYAVPTPLPQVTQQTPLLVPPQQPSPVPTPTPPKQPYAVPTPLSTTLPALVIVQTGKGNQVQTSIAFTNNAPQQINRPVPTHKPKKIGTGKQQVVIHNLSASSPAKGQNFVSRKAGQQAAHDIPRFIDEETGENWDCISSGFYQRRESNGLFVSGVLLHVDTINPLFSDVPAEHPQHHGCITAINRKY